MSDKILVNCCHTTGDVETPTIFFIVAGASAATDNETMVFLIADSVNLAVAGDADGIQQDGHEPLGNYIDSLIENGGKLWVCPACDGPRGITVDDLIDGTEWRGAVPMIDFAKQATVL